MNSIWTIWRRSVCAVGGAMAGGITGLLFGLIQLGDPATAAPLSVAIPTGILLGLLGWFVILLVIGLWLHYGARSIALQSLVTSLITAVLTTIISNQLGQPILDAWIGLLVGTIVGAALCALCGMRQAPMTGGDDHGLR